jgi:hypothetical protein
MLHTVSMRSPGVKPTSAWSPVSQHAVLPGASAATWNAVSRILLFVFLASLAPMMVMSLHGTKGIFFDPFSAFALAAYVLAGVLMFSANGAAAARRRREYRHGYTTMDVIGRYGEYYGTLPQLEAKTGIEIRAAGQARLDRETLRSRTALAKAAGMAAPHRMTRAEATAAAATATAANDEQLAKAKTRRRRAVLVRTLGPEAGSVRDNALRLALAALFTAAGLGPLSIICGAVGSSVTGNPAWFVPLATILAAMAILLVLSRRLTNTAARLTEQRLGLAPGSLPPWPLLKPIPLPLPPAAPGR